MDEWISGWHALVFVGMVFEAGALPSWPRSRGHATRQFPHGGLFRLRISSLVRRSVILICSDDFRACSGRQSAEDLRVDGLLDESDRAVAEEEVTAAGVEAGETIGPFARVIGSLDHAAPRPTGR